MIKTASEFVTALQNVAAHRTLYVMGCFGAPMAERNKDRYLAAQAYNRRPEREEKIRAADGQTYGFDCVCLIKGVLWGWCGDPSDIYGGADYRTDLVPDLDAEQMLEVCNDVSVDFSHILPGEVVGMPGHIGVYVGEGLCIECTPRWKDGVQYTACLNAGPRDGFPGRKWERHGKLPYLRYEIQPAPEPDPVQGKRYETMEQLPCWARRTVEKLYNCGYLVGKGERLDLSEDMIRILVILDRAKVFG